MNPNRFRKLIFAALLAAASTCSFADTITVAPPPLRVYTQPVCPGDGYIWTPGYWAYGPNGYSWVPGAWLLPPRVGYLYTPGYWAFIDGGYLWHRGHWGLQVGYYGGVNYGFGYAGSGFYGGHWDGGHFFYNRTVANIDERRIHNVYREEVHERGRAGVHAHPDRAGIHEAHSREHEAHAHEHQEHSHARPAEHHEKQAAHASQAHSGSGHRAASHKHG